MFLFSCCLMMVVPFLRLSCSTEMDDHVAVVIMLTTAPYFLFFCRYVRPSTYISQTGWPIIIIYHRYCK